MTHLLFLVFSLLGLVSCAESHICTDPQKYEAAANAHLVVQTANQSCFQTSPPLAGHTRSHSIPNLYTLLTPSSRVYGSLPSQWTTKCSSSSAAAVITPALGAHFSMYLVHPCHHSTFSPVGSSSNVESFLYILHGRLQITGVGETRTLEAGGYLYTAPQQSNVTARVISEHAACIQIDRLYARSGSPKSVAASENEVQPVVPAGEVFRLRRLLDATDQAYDFNIHIMDFSPGEFLHVKELHYNQHGLLMLQGHGIYMLGERYMPVTTGDIIYMAPFVPQWYAALGEHQTRYFLYKDTNVDPLISK